MFVLEISADFVLHTEEVRSVILKSVQKQLMFKYETLNKSIFK